MTIPPNVKYQDRFFKAYQMARENCFTRSLYLFIVFDVRQLHH